MAKKTQGQQVQAEHPNQAEQKTPAEPQGGERTRSGRTFRPRVDIRETDTGLMLLADVPGAKSRSQLPPFSRLRYVAWIG
jgi:HSP20 family protein